MVKKYIQTIRPKSGYSHAVYIILNVALPLLVLLLIRLDLALLAVVAVLLSKWRIFAMPPRYWLPNIRANAVDIFVGLSVVTFIAGTQNLAIQVVWTVFFLLWVLFLKPKSNQLAVMSQALIAQVVTLVAFYQAFPDHSIAVGVFSVWLICYLSARHFFGAFEESHTIQISAIWGWFGASLAWVLGHWVIQYISIPQIALVVTLVGYILATMYYFHSNGGLKNSAKTQLISFITILLIIIIAFSDWQDKTI
jgi:hypothetical protein